MGLLKIFFFKIISPMIWLIFFAYAFAFSANRLAKAWKAEKVTLVWLHTWIILVGLYFLLHGGCI